MKNKTLISLFILFQLVAATANANQNFFEQRYRGWLWFENKEKAPADSPRNQNNRASDITPLEAKEEIEQFAKELEESNVFQELIDDSGRKVAAAVLIFSYLEPV